jgi:ABC-type antimicrobial peptide transport system permease subunit
MPWTTCKKKLQGSTFNNVDMIFVSAISQGAMNDVQDEIRTVLRAQHRIAQSESGEWQDDFTLRNLTEIMNAMNAATAIMTALLAAIASISLLVGGIGIMNIMLVSVSERTREIGLRMAIGARSRDVLMQFLVEAVTLASLGGLIGIALGGGGAMFVAKMFHWPAMVSPASVAIAVIFSGGVGVAFGFYPAWRASMLDPIEALRYE